MHEICVVHSNKYISLKPNVVKIHLSLFLCKIYKNHLMEKYHTTLTNATAPSRLCVTEDQSYLNT